MRDTEQLQKTPEQALQAIETLLEQTQQEWDALLSSWQGAAANATREKCGAFYEGTAKDYIEKARRSFQKSGGRRG